MGLSDFADLLAHQGSTNRGFQRDLAGLEVHFVWADDLEFHLGICLQVCEFYLAQKAYSVLGESVGIDHTGVLQDLLQEADAADGLRLPPSCFTVARILAPVALGAGFSDMVTHFWIDHGYKVVQFGSKFVVSLF